MCLINVYYRVGPDIRFIGYPSAGYPLSVFFFTDIRYPFFTTIRPDIPRIVRFFIDVELLSSFFAGF